LREDRRKSARLSLLRATAKGIHALCVEKYDHKAGTIARNLSVISAAFGFACKPQIVRDGFGNEIEVLQLDSAPNLCTQAKEVARLTELPHSTPRDWLPSFEELGRFIDAIDVRQENLFRFVILALNRPASVRAGMATSGLLAPTFCQSADRLV
jgi:hypothetical protein